MIKKRQFGLNGITI